MNYLFFFSETLGTFQSPVGAPKALNKPQRPLKPNSFKYFSFRSITRVKSHTKFQLKILLISKLVFPGLCSLPSVVLPLLPKTIGHSVALSALSRVGRRTGALAAFSALGWDVASSSCSSLVKLSTLLWIHNMGFRCFSIFLHFLLCFLELILSKLGQVK